MEYKTCSGQTDVLGAVASADDKPVVLTDALIVTLATSRTALGVLIGLTAAPVTPAQ